MLTQRQLLWLVMGIIFSTVFMFSPAVLIAQETTNETIVTEEKTVVEKDLSTQNNEVEKEIETEDSAVEEVSTEIPVEETKTIEQPVAVNNALKFTVEPSLIEPERGWTDFAVKAGVNKPAKVKFKLYSYTKEDNEKLKANLAQDEKYQVKFTSDRNKLEYGLYSGGLTGLFEMAKLNLKIGFLSKVTKEELARRRKTIDEKIEKLSKDFDKKLAENSKERDELHKLVLTRKPSEIIEVEVKDGGLFTNADEVLTYKLRQKLIEKLSKNKDGNTDVKGVIPFVVSFKNLQRGGNYVVVVESDENPSLTNTIKVNTWTLLKPFSYQVIVLGMVFIILILLSIRQAANGKEFFIRHIAGLNAIEEAVGRATEMGKPVLYLTGLHDLQSIATLASISILSHVSKKTAEYETPILVPNCRSIVMVTAREVVKEAYISVGKADHYNEDNITYLTDDQFGFTSGVDGIMVREKPAACFYLGHFMAESLIYAETGHSVGAIQIAGTEEFSQIPFFITACDYTLIGEELFAAGAYLSRQPRDVGSLRGQDLGKLIIIAIILIGMVAQSVGYMNGSPDFLSFGEWFRCN